MVEVAGKAKVGIGHGDDRIEALRRAFEAVGGIKRWVREGSKVLVKPNMMTSMGTPTVTHIDHIKGLYLLCKEAGASEVWVGENSVCGMPTRRHFEFAGFHNALESLGCKLRYFEEEPWVYVERESNYCLKDVHLPQALIDADVIIDAPIAKTHEATTTTLGLKNFHGILADEDKARHHRGRPESGSSLMEKFVDIFAFVKDLGKPVLCACDMFHAMEGQGPAFGDIVHMGLAVVSDDVVACDAAVEALMGFPNLSGLLTEAANRRGVGIGDMHYIEILGEPLEKHRREFKPAEWRPLEFEGEGTKVLAGDFCHGGCQMLLRYIIDASKVGFQKDKREFGDLYILCGINPPPPPDDAFVVVYGDCAIYSTWHYSYRQRPKKIGPWWRPRPAFIDVEGCCPLELAWLRKIAELMRGYGLVTSLVDGIRIFESGRYTFAKGVPIVKNPRRWHFDSEFARRYAREIKGSNAPPYMYGNESKKGDTYAEYIKALEGAGVQGLEDPRLVGIDEDPWRIRRWKKESSRKS